MWSLSKRHQMQAPPILFIKKHERDNQVKVETIFMWEGRKEWAGDVSLTTVPSPCIWYSVTLIYDSLSLHLRRMSPEWAFLLLPVRSLTFRSLRRGRRYNILQALRNSITRQTHTKKNLLFPYGLTSNSITTFTIS